MNRIVNIDDLIGIPYKENGRDINGCDCYGYAILVAKRFGHEIPDLGNTKVLLENFSDSVNRGVKLINVKETERPENAGDIIIFKNFCGAENHIGIYLGFGLFTHCNCRCSHVAKLQSVERFIGRCFVWQ